LIGKLFWLALAGALGTVVRYGLGGIVQRATPAFPLGTLAVNGLGCLLFGIVWSLAEERFLVSGETRLVVLVGFMGAFTTFSTYAFETAQMLRDSGWLVAATNVLVQNALGLIGVLAGMAIGRSI
jgi:CrcB protein